MAVLLPAGDFHITIYIIIKTTTINNHISIQIKPTISKVLSSKTANRAMFLSYGGAAIALIMTGEFLKLRQRKLKLESRHVLIVNITNLDVC